MAIRPRLVALIVLVAGVFALATVFVPHSPAALRATVSAAGVLAPAAAFAAWTVLTPALVSGTLLALASGLLLGPWTGAAVGLLGATAGGTIAFLLARCGVAGPSDGDGRLARLQTRLRRRGFASVLVARLAPGVPATLLHYAAGLARVRLRHFVPAIAIGAAPRVLAYAALGASGGDLTSGAGLLAGGLLVALTLAGAGAAAVAWRARARARTRAHAPAIAH